MYISLDTIISLFKVTLDKFRFLTTIFI